MAAKVNKPTLAKPATKTLEAFRKVHDRSVTVPNKIRAGLADLEAKEGPEAWEYEADFVKRATISQTDLGQFRAQFEDHIVEARVKSNTKRVWFVNTAHAKKMREAIS